MTPLHKFLIVLAIAVTSFLAGITWEARNVAGKHEAKIEQVKKEAQQEVNNSIRENHAMVEKLDALKSKQAEQGQKIAVAVEKDIQSKKGQQDGKICPADVDSYRLPPDVVGMLEDLRTNFGVSATSGINGQSAASAPIK